MKPEMWKAGCAGALAVALWLVGASAWAEPLRLNQQGYFEARGLDVLVFSNWYDGLFSDAKISGVELIHHGLRTAANGDVRLMPTPGQWDEIGALADRRVDPATGVIETTLRYPDYDFTVNLAASYIQLVNAAHALAGQN